MTQVDVLIVGAGPAGCSTALHLARNDAAWAGRLLVIDRATFPREKICGGGITYFGYRMLEQLGLEEPGCYPAREARVHYRRRAFSFFGEPTIRIVDRAAFDTWFLRKVEEEGVEVRQGVELEGIEVSADGVVASTTAGVIRARALVAADGSLSVVRRALDWPGDFPLARTLEIVAEIDPDADPDYSRHRMSFDFSAITSHRLQGYTWDFPTSLNGRPAVNRGAFDSRVWPKRPRAGLKQVLSEAIKPRGLALGDHQLKSAPIRWWDGRARLSRPRVLLAGDAAGTDPLFGEGISFAIGHGEVAAACLSDAFGGGDLEFADYNERLLEHPTVRQIPTRYAVARIGYRLRSPIILGTIWALVGRLVPNLETAGKAWRLFARGHRLLGGGVKS